MLPPASPYLSLSTYLSIYSRLDRVILVAQRDSVHQSLVTKTVGQSDKCIRERQADRQADRQTERETDRYDRPKDTQSCLAFHCHILCLSINDLKLDCLSYSKTSIIL